jgi:hypothetical protein
MEETVAMMKVCHEVTMGVLRWSALFLCCA